MTTLLDAMNDTVEARLEVLGLQLPEIVRPRGNFAPYVISGSMLYISGKGAPLREGADPVPKVGAEVTLMQAQRHAQEVALAGRCAHSPPRGHTVRWLIRCRWPGCAARRVSALFSRAIATDSRP